MRLRRHFDSEESTGIDLAPMLDFVMNLLIFFIITAVFVKEMGIQVQRHGGSAGGPSTGKETGSISVVVKASGDIMVDNRIVDVRAVRANVERFHAESPDSPVVVIAAKESPTGVLVQVMDQVRQGGVENVSIAATGGGP